MNCNKIKSITLWSSKMIKWALWCNRVRRTWCNNNSWTWCNNKHRWTQSWCNRWCNRWTLNRCKWCSRWCNNDRWTLWCHNSRHLLTNSAMASDDYTLILFLKYFFFFLHFLWCFFECVSSFLIYFDSFLNRIIFFYKLSISLSVFTFVAMWVFMLFLSFLWFLCSTDFASECFFSWNA